MNPALTTIKNDVRAAELRERAAQRRRASTSAHRGRRAAEVRQVQAAAVAPAVSPLTLVHGFFGREHGSHA